MSLLIKQFSTTSLELLILARISECMCTVRGQNHSGKFLVYEMFLVSYQKGYYGLYMLNNRGDPRPHAMVMQLLLNEHI